MTDVSHHAPPGTVGQAGIGALSAVELAVPVAETDGGWSVVDLDSDRGTYLNDGLNPIPANEPQPLDHGDRIHLGAWTTLTVIR